MQDILLMAGHTDMFMTMAMKIEMRENASNDDCGITINLLE